MDTKVLKATYERDGFVSGVPVLSAAEAASGRAALESAEQELGPLHYKFKIHTVMRRAFELATRPAMLDLVEAILGPNILLYNVTFIVKEPHSPAHVTWHQDLTYWGLSSDKQVSAWLALSPASAESGCMRMVPGSHKAGRRDHEVTQDESNVLFNGQRVAGVDEGAARLCALQPGEASFHHGWTLHASFPNASEDRRIGLNMQFLATDVRQTLHDKDSAMLVRGVDAYHNFAEDQPAAAELDLAAWQRQQSADALFRTAYKAAI